MDDAVKIKSVEPKSLPFKCPNCLGYGTVGYAKKICHSCNGRGIVTVDQKTGEIHEPNTTT